MGLYRLWLFHRRALVGSILGSVLLLGSIFWLGSRPVRAPDPSAVLVVDSATPIPSVWDTATTVQRQADVLAALNCARTRHGLPPLALDPQLSAAAADGWHTLQQDVAADSAAVLDAYPWSAVVTITEDGPTSADCGWPGFDPRADPGIQTISAVGIAVFPPLAYSGASAVIVGRRMP